MEKAKEEVFDDIDSNFRINLADGVSAVRIDREEYDELKKRHRSTEKQKRVLIKVKQELIETFVSRHYKVWEGKIVPIDYQGCHKKAVTELVKSLR